MKHIFAKYAVGVTIAVSALLPVTIAYAQTTPISPTPLTLTSSSQSRSVATTGTGGVQRVIGQVQDIMNSLVPFMITLALLYFLYGVGKYVLEPSGIEGARDIMLYGLIGLFVMISVWGLVNFIGDTFGVEHRSVPTQLPHVDPSAAQR